MDKTETLRYIKQTKLGEGTFGQAVLVKDTHENNLKVLKKINIRGLRPEQVVNVTKEALNLGILDHPHVIKYCDSFADPFYFYIVTEYCEDGDLAKRLSENSKKNIKLPEDLIVKWVRQLVSAIDYLHNSKNIIHRDIKTQNIFIKEECLKFGDFGLARTVTSFANTFAGTPIYMAPEILHYKPYTKSADVWSLGVVMFEMLTYQVPFKSPAEILANDVPSITGYADEIISFCKKLLEKDPNKRISIYEIKKELETFEPRGISLEITRRDSLNDLQHLVSSLTDENRLLRSQSVEKDENLKELEKLKDKNKKLDEDNKKLNDKCSHLLKIIDELITYKDKHKQIELKNQEMEKNLASHKNLNELLQKELNELKEKIKELENNTRRFREPLFTRTLKSSYKRAESVDILNSVNTDFKNKENSAKKNDIDMTMTQLIDKIDSALIKSDKKKVYDEKILKEKTNHIILSDQKLLKPSSFSIKRLNDKKDVFKASLVKCEISPEWEPLKSRVKSKNFKEIELNNETWDICVISDNMLIVVCWDSLLIVDKTFKIIDRITKINDMGFQSYSVSCNGIDRIYISDWAHDRIVMTDYSFNFIKSTIANSPYGISFYDNHLYVCEPENKRIIKLDSDLQEISSYTLNDKPWQIKIINNIACVKHQNTSIRFYNLENFFLVHKFEGHGGNITSFKGEHFIEHSAENKKIYLYDKYGNKCDDIDTCGYGRLIPQDMYYGINIFNNNLLLTTQASNKLVVI